MAKRKNDLKRVLTFRVSDELYNNILQTAKSAHISHGEYIRRILANRKVVIRQEIVADVPQLKRVIAELGKIGSNLNQIAHYFNGSGEQSSVIYEKTQSALAAVFDMKRDVESMGGEFRGYSEARLRKKQ